METSTVENLNSSLNFPVSTVILRMMEDLMGRAGDQSVESRSQLSELVRLVNDHGEYRLTVRQLIGRWGASGRGYKVRERIDSDLRENGLRTDPLYDEVAIDTPIRVVVLSEGSASAGPNDMNQLNLRDGQAEIGLHVGLLTASSAGVESVKREEDLAVAVSKMLLKDYSQLVVTSGRDDYFGSISWESIGRARLREQTPTMRGSVTYAHMVQARDDLISLVPRIYSEGFIVVEDASKKHRAGGIVTTADLTLQFSDLATPFFLLGEIERRIRRRVDATFGPTDLSSMRDPKDAKSVESAADLSLGELERLLEEPVRWEKLAWNLDRKTFMERMREVRELRNDVMHFNPDPVGQTDVALLRSFVNALRTLPS